MNSFNLTKGIKFNVGGVNYTKLDYGQFSEDYKFSADNVEVNLGHIKKLKVEDVKIGNDFLYFGYTYTKLEGYLDKEVGLRGYKLIFFDKGTEVAIHEI